MADWFLIFDTRYRFDVLVGHTVCFVTVVFCVITGRGALDDFFSLMNGLLA